MAFDFSRATQRDGPEIFALYCLVMRPLINEIWGWEPDWQERDFSAHFDPHAITQVRDGPRLVAYSQVERHPEHFYIRMLAVHPDFRRRGIASDLLRGAVGEALSGRKPLRLQVFKQNTAAKRLYLSRGFRILAETQSSLVMERHDWHEGDALSRV